MFSPERYLSGVQRLVTLTGSPNYQGPSGFSEPETLALDRYARSRRDVTAFLDAHCCMSTVRAPAVAYGAEAGQSVTIEVPELQLGDLKDKPSVLANAGLLLATLYDGEEEVIQISMLTQVEKAGEALVRTIFSPLDQ